VSPSPILQKVSSGPPPSAGNPTPPVKANYEPDDEWLGRQVSMGKTKISPGSVDSYKPIQDLPNGMKIMQEPGYGGAMVALKPDSSITMASPYNQVGRVTHDNKGKIVNFAVSPDHQKQGLGTAMLQAGADHGIFNPHVDPEDVSKAGAAAINKYRANDFARKTKAVQDWQDSQDQ
jgi:ribosomal protein S18 acetylase RimI-like enzyme